MGAEVEAARVRAAEARTRQAASDYDARLAAYGPSHQLTMARGEALAARQAELAEAREQLRQAARPATVRASDVEPGMMLRNPYGGTRGRFTAAAAPRQLAGGGGNRRRGRPHRPCSGPGTSWISTGRRWTTAKHRKR